MKHRSLVSLFAVAFAPALVCFAACGGSSDAAPPPVTPVASASTTAVASTTAAPIDSAAPVMPAAPMTMLDLQKKTLSGFGKAIAAHDGKAVASFFAIDGTTTHVNGSGDVTTGRDAIAANYTALFGGFSDLKIGAERVFSSKNIAIAQWVMTGTNDGDMMGMKATKKPIGVRGATVYTFNDDGLIAKSRIYFDLGTMLAQEGVTPQKVRDIPVQPTGDPEWITPKGDGSDDKSVAAWNAQLDAFNKHDLKAYGALLTDDVVGVDYSTSKDMVGRDANVKSFGELMKMFPDVKTNSDNVWGFGDLVVDETTSTGTMKGAMGPFKPTGKPIIVHVLDVDRMKDGKLAKSESYASSAEIFGQLMPKGHKKPTK